MLGLVAGHALRTSLGFADHHAFDYPWLGVTALGLVLLVTQDGWSKRTALGIAGLTGGVAGQVLAWEAGPLLIVPVGLIVAGLAVGWVRAGESPLVQGLPIVGGLSGAAAIVWAVHTGLGWHTTVVASAPVLLTAGAGGVLLVTEAIFRTRPDARLAGGAVLASGLVGLPTIAIVQPAAWATLTARVSGTLIRTDAIAETDGLFADSAGWLLLFGFVLVLALPYLGWATRRALDDLRWVVPVGYAWAFLSLAVLQVRFVGEFATFAAVFAGLGFVHLAERVDLARPPQPFSGAVDGHMLTLPDRQQAGSIVLLFLLVGGLGLIQVPIKTNQVTTPAPMYETAAWMDDYTERSEWGDRPEYVLSQWGDNRMYNYHVSGNSRSYRFARQNYPVFLGAVDAQTWYERLSGRTGFIVYAGTSGPERTVAARLAAFGSRTSAVSGLAHYRAVYDSPDGPYRVFTLVPGATLVGTAEPNTTVTVATTTTVAGSDRTVEYERRVATDAEGQYRVTVPYPGEYTSPTGTTAVSERAVLSGTTVSINGTTG
jgi:dolichyl-diphosphooligosaccharide--protein glycosyltransferase